jgi:NAD(P)-dependent dehydrogenase (short-subunit alcohol dehydrogenase family)
MKEEDEKMDDKGASRPSALVTGGARGIGRAITRRLQKDGFDVVILDMRPPEDAVGEGPGELAFFEADITDATARTAALDFVRARFGRLDVLVNNAGVAPRVRADLLETGEESLDFVLGVNLRGTFFLTQAAARWMVAQRETVVGHRPCIVNISSMSAYTSSVNRGEYCLSKAGVSMVTTLFADRLAEYGIPVHEIRPGIIRTDMTAKVEEKYDRLIAGGLLPIARWGTPEDVADAVAVLVSGQLSYSTGQILDVDGGFHIRRI